MKDMKECMKPHAIVHSVTGLGVGLILVALIPALVTNALVFGIIVVLAALGYDYFFIK